MGDNAFRFLNRQEDNHWRDNLVKQVQHSELELIAHFAETSLRLSQTECRY
jgi:flagellar motor switch protein FliM